MIRSPGALRQKAPHPSRHPRSVRRHPAVVPDPFRARAARTYSTIPALKRTGVLSRSPLAGRRWMARTTSIPSTTLPNAA